MYTQDETKARPRIHQTLNLRSLLCWLQYSSGIQDSQRWKTLVELCVYVAVDLAIFRLLRLTTPGAAAAILSPFSNANELVKRYRRQC